MFLKFEECQPHLVTQINIIVLFLSSFLNLDYRNSFLQGSKTRTSEEVLLYPHIFKD